MDWEKLDWAALDRLRDGFLSGAAGKGPYWRTLSDLEQYDITFGERIGWKWDAVLSELKQRGWSAQSVQGRSPHDDLATPPDSSAQLTLVDWGCGSGVAGRRVIEAWDAEQFSTLLVWDHSPLAREFALRTAKTRFPKLNVGELTPTASIDVLVVSHVLNELSSVGRAELLTLASRARAIVWVEPGTHAVSRDLIGIRETLRAEFSLVAPCTHRAQCGLLAAENVAHWCHYFAPPPSAIYADSDWVKFGQRAGIDLRSLPYSFLVMAKSTLGAEGLNEGAARIVGEPRHFKGFAKLLSCDAAGVADLTLQKRDDPALFKALKRGVSVPVYRWSRDGDKIKDAQPVFSSPEQHSEIAQNDTGAP